MKPRDQQTGPPRNLDGSIDATKINWEDLVPKLLFIANNMIARRSQTYGVVVPEDLVQDAIEKTITGQRTWPDHLTAISYFVGVMRSDLYAKMSRTEVQRTRLGYPSPSNEENSDEIRGDSITSAAITSAEDSLLDGEIWAFLRAEFEDDPLALKCLHIAFHDGIVSPTKISKRLGVTRSRVRRTQARILARHIDLQFMIFGEVVAIPDDMETEKLRDDRDDEVNNTNQDSPSDRFAERRGNNRDKN